MRLRPLLFSSLALVAVSFGQAPKTAPAPVFTRLIHLAGSSVETMQTRAARYAPKSGTGTVVWLIGVAHIGQPGYYKEIQKLLDAQAVVLYEGVQREDKTVQPTTDMSSTYKLFSDAVGLSFQLNAIDYKKPSFKNSDMTWEAMTAMSEKQGGKEGAQGLANVGNLLDSNSSQGKMLATFLTSIKSDPGSQEAMRLVLAEALTNPNALSSVLSPLQSDVILRARNDKVFADLSEALKAVEPPKSIAIFYGAAHMPDLEARITKSLNYQWMEDRWYTGIAGDEKKVTGNGQMILTMFRNMKPPTTPPKKGG
jgi:hypothetical protein